MLRPRRTISSTLLGQLDSRLAPLDAAQLQFSLASSVICMLSAGWVTAQVSAA
jgi:hypothetical protein